METRRWQSLRHGVVGALVLAACMALAILTGCSSASNEDAVFVQPVSSVNYAQTALVANRYGGVIESQKTENITVDQDKKVDEIYVSEGDSVAKGDKLFSYDTEATDLQVQRGELEIERLSTLISDNNSQISTLQNALNSASAADKPGLSAQIQQLQADAAQAEYDRKTKAAEVDKLKATVADPYVYASIGGTVQTVNPSAASGGVDENGQATAFMTILASGDLRVKGKVSEQNIYEITAGQEVIVRSRVNSDMWRGTIGSIETQPEQNQNAYYDAGSGNSASSYPFYVNLESSEGLMLGQHVTIEVDYGQGETFEGLWLDEGWLVREGDAAYVWAVSKPGDKLAKRSVELGKRDDGLGIVEIVSGLSDADYIAWPDDSCAAGAATTQDSVASYDDDDMSYDGAMLEGDAEEGAMADGAAMDEAADGADAAPADATEEAVFDQAESGDGAHEDSGEADDDAQESAAGGGA